MRSEAQFMRPIRIVCLSCCDFVDKGAEICFWCENLSLRACVTGMEGEEIGEVE